MNNQLLFDESLTREECKNLIKTAKPEQCIFIEGDNGIGKTSLCKEVAQELSDENKGVKMGFIFIDGKSLQEGDLTIPSLNRETNTLSMVLQKNIYDNAVVNPAVLVLDEVSKAPVFAQKQFSAIGYERRVGEHYLHPLTKVIMSGNLADEGFGDALDGTFRSRVTVIRFKKPNGKTIAEYGATQGWHETVQMMCVENSDKFGESYTDLNLMGFDSFDKRLAHNPYIYDPEIAKDGFVNPRTLENASKWMHEYGSMLSEKETYLAVRGSCGSAFANDLFQLLKTSNELPNWGEVENDPSGARVPTNGVPMIMMVYRCLNNINSKNYESILTYVQRLSLDCQDMFFQLLKLKSKTDRDTLKVFNALVSDTKFQQWCMKNQWLRTPDKKESK